MSYKIRNSIALGVILLLVIAIGIYITLFYQPKKIKQYEKESQKISSQLQNNAEQLNAIADAESKLRETVHRWNNRTKEIPEIDLSSQTYGYLSDIVDESGGPNFKLNMTLTGSRDGGKLGYNTYKLVGSSEFPNIFRFLWLLENGRRLYKIATIGLRSDEVGADTMEHPKINIQFDIEIQAFFTTEKALGMRVMKSDSTPQPITSNPFSPSILAKTPANVRKLLDVDQISVKATSVGKALVMTNDGRLLTLRIGDEVFLGRVTSVNPQEGSVLFTLNNGGIVEVKKKQIQFEKNEKGNVQ